MTSAWIELTGPRAEALAGRHGTPFYVYDLDVLRARARRLRAAFPSVTLLYAVKANPHPRVLERLKGEVDGLDVASDGELAQALRAGWPPGVLSFAGPGKTGAELERAVGAGVVVSVESPRELEAVAVLARTQGRRATIRLRVNAATRAKAYRVPMMGGPSPFGIDEEDLAPAAARVAELAEVLAFDGLHVHPGAQCTSVGGFSAALSASLDLVERLHREHGLTARRLDLGGGLGVLEPGVELDVEAAGRRLCAALEKFHASTGLRVEAVLEPGRWLVGPAGLYVARVVSEKVSRGVHFTVLDGGLNHHLAATGQLFGADAPRLPLLNLSREGPLVTRTIVGPLCTPLDTLGTGVTIAEPRVGDLIAVLGSGAYGPTFSPLGFLSHRPPAELVLPEDGDGGQVP